MFDALVDGDVTHVGAPEMADPPSGRTLLRESAYPRASRTSNKRQAVLPIYLTDYNQHRDHSSLGCRPPMTRTPGVNNADGIHATRFLWTPCTTIIAAYIDGSA